MTFKEKLTKKKFITTFEVGPPKGISLEKILEEIAPLKGRVDAVNVTDLQSSVMRMSSLGASIILKNNGFEPLVQVTCRDRNRLALQSDILTAAAFGLENILALTGDHPVLGDHPETKPVFDIDSVQLIEVVRKLETGFDMNAHKLKSDAPHYCVGAVVNPGADPLEPELIKMEKKIKAGAEFFQTQAIYDLPLFEKFLKNVEPFKTKIFASLVFLKSERMAHYLNEHVPGVFVPQHFIDELATVEDKKAKSLEISVRLALQLKSMCQGIHLISMGWYGLLPSLLDAMGVD